MEAQEAILPSLGFPAEVVGKQALELDDGRGVLRQRNGERGRGDWYSSRRYWRHCMVVAARLEPDRLDDVEMSVVHRVDANLIFAETPGHVT